MTRQWLKTAAVPAMLWAIPLSAHAVDVVVPLQDTGYYAHLRLGGDTFKKFNLPAYNTGGRGNSSMSEEARSFFVFNLPPCIAGAIQGVSLRLYQWNQCPHAEDARGCAWASQDSSEVLTLVHPDVDASTLLDPGGARQKNFTVGPHLQPIYEQLAQGEHLASVTLRPLGPGDPSGWIEIPLTGPGAIAAIHTAAQPLLGPKPFVIGGFIESFEFYQSGQIRNEGLFTDHLIPHVPPPQLIFHVAD